MFPPQWFLPYDALFQLLTAVVALAVALYALRGYQWIKERTLLAMSLAFLILSFGMFINGLTLSYVALADLSFTQGSGASIADIGFWTYYIMSIAAYSLLVFAYSHRLMGSSSAMAAGGMGRHAGESLTLAGPLMELILSALLFIIIVAQLIHNMTKRSRASWLVTISFALLLASHILIMFSSVEDLIYVAGRIAELAGFMTLLVVLVGLRRIK